MALCSFFLPASCGGGATHKPTVEPKPVEAPLDPACPAQAEFTLADGKLRCRELPLTVDWPANSQIKRADDQNLTFMSATLDRGVLAIFLEPRFDVIDDAAGLKKRLELAIKGIAGDSTISEVAAPPQEGATVSTGLSFTTSDGGLGIVHGYLAHNWFVAVIAGGRKAETPARPDQPVGKAFLASLKLRPISTKWFVQDVFKDVKLELPAGAFEGIVPKPEGTVEVETKLYAVPPERMWIGVRDLQVSPKCEMFNGVTDADVPALVKKMFGKDDLEVTGKLVKVATQAMYAELATPGGTMTMYLVCRDPRVVLVTVTGKRTAAELKTILDRVTSKL